jgi:hypothetical protein
MAASCPTRRYGVGDCLGVGASGRVFSVQDGNLQRTIAVKMITPAEATDSASISQIVSEARMTASLSHPNVVPVYDLDVDAQGRTYFSMKLVEGRSLGDVIQQSTLQLRETPIATVSRIVNIFMGISQALAYAHRQSIVHQDIKPDNIMLGSFGEVLVVDWGSAARLTAGTKPKLYGTPLYMSPEQARAESVDRRSDVYCLGATLFHAIILRPPTYADEPDDFWIKKKAGEVDPLSDLERSQAPATLISIVFKSLSRDPRDRYQDAEEFLKDLQAFQAGLSVTAYHDSWVERCMRWHRKHGRQLWGTVLVVALIMTVLLLIYGERVEEVATWGSPLVVEDFKGDAWKNAWLPSSGGFRSNVQGIVSQDRDQNIIMLNRRFSCPVAIEFDGESLPGSPIGDLSAVWTSDITVSADHTRVESMQDPFLLQFGAYDGSSSMICKIPRRDASLSYSVLKPQIGRRYHIRAQVADERLELLVDGKLICSWSEPFSFNSGYIGLFGMHLGKAFSNVRIYTRGVAKKVRATAIGDAFVQEGDFKAAAKQYARVVDTFPDSALGREARYKEGLCFYGSGDYDSAFQTWKSLRTSEYSGLIVLQDIDRLFASGKHVQALAAMHDLYSTGSAQLRADIAVAWGRQVRSLLAVEHLGELPQYLAFHDANLLQEPEEDRNTGVLLQWLKRNQEIIQRYPEQRALVASAYMSLGDYEAVLRSYSDQVYLHSIAAFYLGQFDQIDPEDGTFTAITEFMTGDFTTLRRKHPEETVALSWALAYEGKTDQAVALVRSKYRYEESMILANAGRSTLIDDQDANVRTVAQGDLGQEPADHKHQWADWLNAASYNLRGMRAWRQGHLQAAQADFDAAVPQAIQSFYAYTDTEISGRMFTDFAVPLLHSLAGEKDSFSQACREAKRQTGRKFQQRLLYQARFLLGEATEAEFLAQPFRLYAPAQLILMQALRADHAGQVDVARSKYQAWLAIPTYQRAQFPDLAWSEFVAYRLEHLSRQAKP